MTERREDVPVVVVEKSGGGLGAFLFGLLAGAALGLLLAPQSGEETRRALRERGRRLRDAAEEGYAEAKARVERGFESVRETWSDTQAGARDAVQAGKAAVHSAREELERQLAQTRAPSEKAATPSAEDESPG